MNNDDLLWRHLQGVPAFRALLRAVESRFYRNIELRRPVLDLGCGDGHFAATTFSRDHTPDVGVDPSWTILQEARDRQVYSLAVGAAGDRLPFPSEHFGTAICNSVLEHIPDVDSVLGEAARVLAQPGGTLVLTVPSEHFTRLLSLSSALRIVGLDRAAAAYEGWFNRISRHHHCDPPQVWHQRMAAAGFRTLRWQYYFSAHAMRRLEWGHYLGVPSLISRWLLGRWIIAPWRSSLQWTERWLRPAYEEPPPEVGAYLLFVAERVAPGEGVGRLPAPSPLGLPQAPSEQTIGERQPEAGAESTERSSSLAVSSKASIPAGAPAAGAPRPVVPGVRTLIWLALAFVFAAVAQMSWNWQERPFEPATGFTWYGLAMVALGIFVWQSRPRRLSAGPAVRTAFDVARLRSQLPRGGLLLAAALLSWWSWLQVTDMVRPEGGALRPLLTWAAGVALAVLALWPGAVERLRLRLLRPRTAGRSEHSSRTAPSAWPSWEIAAVAALVVLAFLVRFVGLGEMPYVLSGDEASMGLEAWRVINGELTNPFITGWFSHPTLFFFLLALPIKLLGRTTFALRFLSPFVGALTVLATYLFARRAWGRRVAVLGSLLLAGYHFHVHYSRLALNNVWDPLFALAVMGLLWRGWHSQNRRDYLAAGLVLGLSQFFYMGARMLPLLAAGLGAYWLIRDRRRLWRARGNLLALLAVALVVSLPIVLHSLSHPDDYMARVNQLGIFPSGWLEREVEITGKSQGMLLREQLWKALLAFNYTVDPTFWYRPSIPLLRFWPSILFVFGLALALIGAKRTSNFVLLMWFGATVVFAGFLLENPPSSQRYLIAAPVVCLLVAYALVWVSDQLWRLLGGRKAAWLAAAILVAVGIAWGDLSFYFGSYTREADFGGLNTEVAQRVSDYLSDLGPEWSALFLGPPRMGIADGSGFPTVPFLVPEVERHDIPEPLTSLSQLPAVPSPVVFIFLPERAIELQVVRDAFPIGVEKHFPGRFGQLLFIAYEVE